MKKLVDYDNKTGCCKIQCGSNAFPKETNDGCECKDGYEFGNNQNNQNVKLKNKSPISCIKKCGKNEILVSDGQHCNCILFNTKNEEGECVFDWFGFIMTFLCVFPIILYFISVIIYWIFEPPFVKCILLCRKKRKNERIKKNGDNNDNQEKLNQLESETSNQTTETSTDEESEISTDLLNEQQSESLEQLSQENQSKNNEDCN